MKILLLIRTLVLSLLFILSSQQGYADHFQGHVQVEIRYLSEKEQQGQTAFNNYCAKCHGDNASGTRKGPPLIHDIYNPGHHSNRSFYSAVRKGVSQHHWPYGDMPAQKQVSFSEMGLIVQFIRTVQKQNGIQERTHTM